MTHLTVELLGDYADGLLASDASRAAAAHLAACAECDARLAALASLRAHATAAPRAIEPPGDDLWPSIRDEIVSRGARANDATARRDIPRWRRAPALAVAAAAIIAVASSAATLLVVRGRGGETASPVVTGPAPRDTSGVAASPVRSARDAIVRYAALARDYDRTAAELRAALDAQRGTLAPATVATVERSLRTIDAAIAEARAALARDPGNQALLEMLTSTHEQRLDLLRRATH
ncbi:MAG TPA: zf-HC2 domain-containing protein, partial [Gemmatimonadaceae bacterium]|nr:zf-HC2 domain-containing protein [Gemmatimonadaceae bacterium]